MKRSQINLSVDPDIRTDMTNRKDNFNFSQFFSTRYRHEFLSVPSLEKRAAFLEKEKNRILEKIKILKDGQIIRPESSDRRCLLCLALFNEAFSLRKRVNVYANINVCQNCYSNNPLQVQALIESKKTNEVLPNEQHTESDEFDPRKII